MGAPNIGSWNLIELLQYQFSQKEVLYGNNRDLQNFKLPLHVFNHCETTRHDKITNELIIES